MADPILIVDEAPTNRKLTQRVLAAAGYEVRAVPDADAALNAIPEFRPRLVLTDLRLNGMDGLALTRRIKEDPGSRETVVIVVTGCDTEDDRRAAAHAGCDDFIVKPIDTRALPAVIQAHLVRSRQASAAPVPPLPAPTELPPWAAELGREFLAEGRARCAALLDSSATAAEIRAAAHVWAGLGGTFGHAAITTMARRIHDRLSRPGAGRDQEVNGLLHRLLLLFKAADSSAAAGADPAVPPALKESLRGRRIALSGVDPARAGRLSRALLGAGAEVLESVPALPSACDLVIAASSEAAAILERRRDYSTPKLLLAGTPPDGPLGGCLVEANGLDFVAEWNEAEILTRACRLLAPAVEPAPPAPKPSGQAWKIVIADDDPTILTLLKTTVENSGMECAIAREGDEALQLIRSTPADAVILDIMMPNMDGLEVLAAVRNDPALRHVRILVLSALQQETDIVRAFGLGADDYVTKPFSPVEVVARLQRLKRSAA